MGGRVVPYVKKQIDCEELPLRNSQEGVESLWVKIREGSTKDMVGVYYRPPDQGEPVDKAFLLQLQEVLHLQSHIQTKDFNHSDIC